MRIAMIGPFGLHPNKTMRSRALNLARLLVRRGHEVRILMPPWQTPQEADRTWEEDGVQLRYIRLAGGMTARTGRLIRETVAWQPQVVHGFKPKAYSGLVMWWLWRFRRRSLRLVTDTDDWEGAGGWNDAADYSRLQKRFFGWQERWGYRHCHTLTVASRTLQSLAWSLGVPRQKVVYLPNGPGIPLGKPSAPDSSISALRQRPSIALYSRLFEFDVERLVSVLRQVKSEVPELAILIVGTSLKEQDGIRLGRLLAAAGLQEDVVDLGWVEEGRLPGILSVADVAVYLMDDTLLNRTKCPVKLADLLSLGVPVVAEEVGQISQYVIHEKTGLLCASGDQKCLVASLTRLLRDSGERKRLSQGAREHYASNFTWDRLSRIAETAYGEV